MSITSAARKNKRVYCTIVNSVTLAWLSLVNIQVISWNRDQREFTSRPRRASSRPICKLIVLSRLTALGAPKMGGAWRPIVSWFLRYQDRKEVMQKARSILKDKDCSVFEDISKAFYSLKGKHKDKHKSARQNAWAAYFSKRHPVLQFVRLQPIFYFRRYFFLTSLLFSNFVLVNCTTCVF